MAKKKTSRNRSGDSSVTSVANIINEQNGTSGELLETLPTDQQPDRFFLISERGRKSFAWVIGICTGLLTFLTVYTNFIRDDEGQTRDIKTLKATQSEIKETVKLNHAAQTQQLKETNALAHENKNALQRVETMQSVILERLNELRPSN